MAEEAAVDRGLRHDAARRVVVSFLRIHALELRAVAAHDQLGTRAGVVWTSDVTRAVELKLVTACMDYVADLHLHVLFGLVTGDHRHADDEYRNAEVRDLHAVVTASLHAQFLPRRRLTGGDANAFPQVEKNRRRRGKNCACR